MFNVTHTVAFLSSASLKVLHIRTRSNTIILFQTLLAALIEEYVKSICAVTDMPVDRVGYVKFFIMFWFSFFLLVTAFFDKTFADTNKNGSNFFVDNFLTYKMFSLVVNIKYDMN